MSPKEIRDGLVHRNKIRQAFALADQKLKLAFECFAVGNSTESVNALEVAERAVFLASLMQSDLPGLVNEATTQFDKFYEEVTRAV